MELLFRPYYTRWEVAEFLVNLLLDRLRIHLFNGVMFEHPPDLSSDIEYMLQSGQVSLKILSETLVDSWYPIIFQLALSILGNDVEARQVAIDTSVAALLGMHDYSSSTGVQKWLLRYAAHHILSKSKQGTAKGALPDFRRWFPDRQERKPRNSSENTLEPENDEMKITWGVLASSLIEDRLPTILYYQLNLKIGDIAEILKCEEHTVHFRLQKSRSRLRRELEASGLHNAAIKTGYLERLLRRTCQQHRHDTQLQPNQRTMILLEISRLVNRKQVAQRAHITVQEFSTIALVVLVVAIISWGFSSLLPVPQSLPASQSTGSPVAEQSAAAVKPDRGDLQDQGDIEFPLDSVIHYIVQPGDTLDIVSKRLGTSPLVVKKLNNLPEDVSLLAGQVLELRTANTGGTGKFPVIAPYRSPVLLTAQSPPSLIFQRIQEHDLYYQSMWAEGRVIFYGPAGYSGPPRSSRIQVWSKPGSVLVIAGPPESNPDGVVLSINSSDSSSRKTYLALRSGDRDQWFYSDEEILQRKSPLDRKSVV